MAITARRRAALRRRRLHERKLEPNGTGNRPSGWILSQHEGPELAARDHEVDGPKQTRRAARQAAQILDRHRLGRDAFLLGHKARKAGGPLFGGQAPALATLLGRRHAPP